MIKFIALNILKFFDSFHQRKILKFLKKNGYQTFNIFFDVGAHHGESIKLFSKNFEIKNLYSFEPSLTNYKILESNLLKLKKIFSKTQIRIENIAFGDEIKSLKMKYMSESSSSTINDIDIKSNYFKKKSFFLYNKTDQNFFIEETIIQKKIGDYLLDNKISNINFLKIDTEGYELNVLKGLGDQFEKVSMIMFEHHYHNMIIKNYKFNDINNLLVRNNFKQIYKSKMPFRKTFEYIYVRKQ